ncbi:MAG: hypothetical protein QXV21_05215 [Candidatus Bathyarchaeia archaeon]
MKNETPSEEAPKTLEKVPKKTLYLTIGLVAIVLVSIVAFMYFMPTGEAVAVPLSMNYSVGERITYNVTTLVSIPGVTNAVITIMRMDVLSFDGSNYTIRYTIEMSGYPSFSFNITMNKSGYILNYTGLPPELQNLYSTLVGLPGYGAYFPKEEAKVGESWSVPIDVNMSGGRIVGTVNYGIGGVENKTFSGIGGRRVFKITVSANNIQGTFTSDGTTNSFTLSLNGYIYMEYGTCLPIASSIQETVTTSSNDQLSVNIEMRLIQHVKP